MSFSEQLKSSVRTVRNWPKPGINFRDVTTVFQNPPVFQRVIDALTEAARERKVQVVAGIDARGFIMAGAVAYHLGVPLAMVRKKGKLPYKTLSADYDLEYGSATIEIHADACHPGQRVLILDDLIATGGTLLAAAKLFRALQADVVGVAAIIDLPELQGSTKLRAAHLDVVALCEFSETE